MGVGGGAALGGSGVRGVVPSCLAARAQVQGARGANPNPNLTRSKEHVERLRAEHSIYLTGDGRISMAGVTAHNVDYIAQARTLP